MLVKLLDAGQRLPVHVHPDREFARSHLGCPYGKTEAWFVLDADPGSAVYLGWRDDVDPDELAARRDAQDGAWMLERMHRIEVSRGDGILVPAGTVHAIGEGVFVLEAQEPTDFSILLEWSVTTETRDGSHLGLGFDTAMGAVSHRAAGRGPAARADQPRRPGRAGAGVLPGRDGRSVLPGRPGRRRARRCRPGSPRWSCWTAAALTGAGGSVELAAGQAWAVPAGFGDWTADRRRPGCWSARPGRAGRRDLVAVGAG